MTTYTIIIKLEPKDILGVNSLEEQLKAKAKEDFKDHNVKSVKVKKGE